MVINSVWLVPMVINSILKAKKTFEMTWIYDVKMLFWYDRRNVRG